jgi:hypothetical protein
MFERTKKHLKDNKAIYIAAAGTSAVTVVSVVWLKQSLASTQINNVVAPVFNNDNSSMVNMGGHMTKIVKRASDGKVWEKVTEAATDEGVSISRMSRHLNGHSPELFGEIYEIIGVGTTG